MMDGQGGSEAFSRRSGEGNTEITGCILDTVAVQAAVSFAWCAGGSDCSGADASEVTLTTLDGFEDSETSLGARFLFFFQLFGNAGRCDPVEAEGPDDEVMAGQSESPHLNIVSVFKGPGPLPAGTAGTSPLMDGAATGTSGQHLSLPTAMA